MVQLDSNARIVDYKAYTKLWNGYFFKQIFFSSARNGINQGLLSNNAANQRIQQASSKMSKSKCKVDRTHSREIVTENMLIF